MLKGNTENVFTHQFWLSIFLFYLIDVIRWRNYTVLSSLFVERKNHNISELTFKNDVFLRPNK